MEGLITLEVVCLLVSSEASFNSMRGFSLLCVQGIHPSCCPTTQIPGSCSLGRRIGETLKLVGSLSCSEQDPFPLLDFSDSYISHPGFIQILAWKVAKSAV